MISFDVMLDGRFVKSFKVSCSQTEQHTYEVLESTLTAFVIQKLPSLKGKQFKIYMNDLK